MAPMRRVATAPGSAGRRPSAPRSRSPLLAFAALVGSAVLAAGTAAGRPALAVAVLLVQLVLGLCWLVVLGAPLLTAVLVGLAALASDSVLLRDRDATAGSVAGVLGLAMLASIVQQLARRGRRDVTDGFGTAVSGVVLVAAVSLLLPLRELESGQAVALTALVAVAVAVVVARLLPGPLLPVRIAALVLGALVGGRYGAASEELAAGWALAAAAAAGAAAVVIDLGVVRMGPEVASRQQSALRPVAALLPVVAALPVAYVVGWVMIS
jgi:hypothetical protein